MRPLTADMHLYTPAIVHLSTPLDIDPLDAYFQESGKCFQRYVIVSPVRLFRGLQNPKQQDQHWDFTLHGIPHEEWPGFCSWFGSCVYRTPDGLIRRVRIQEIAVADPAEITGDPLPITAFVVESQIGSFYFRRMVQTTDSLYEPYFDRELAYQDTKLLAQALEANPADPYNFVKQNLEKPSDPTH